MTLVISLPRCPEAWVALPIFATAVGASACGSPRLQLGSAPPLGGGLGCVSHTTNHLKEVTK